MSVGASFQSFVLSELPAAREARLGGGLGARAAQLNGLTDIHFDGTLVVFRRGEISELAVALDEPECGRDDTDANRRVTGLEPLKCGHSNAHALCPGPQ